jgi:heptosyltransferase-2
MKILLRLPNWIGDIVMATPALRAVRAGFPDAEIALLGPAAALSMLDGAPWFDRAIALPRERGPLAPWRLGRSLRAERFDAAILLPNSWSSAVVALAAGIPRRIGYDNDFRGVLLTESLPVRRVGRLRPVPMVEYYLALCRKAGCPIERTARHLELPVTGAAIERTAAWDRAHGLAPDERPIAFNVGASFGGSKLWTIEGWAAVAEHFLRAGRRVIVYGGPSDRPVVEAVLAATKVAGAIGTTEIPLQDLCAHMRRAALLVSTDSGGRHFGVAAGIPVVVLMGPTHPNYTELDYDRYCVLLEKVECWPCHLRTCPIDHRCMRRIGPERVIAAAEDFLAGRRPFGGARPWLTAAGGEDAAWRPPVDRKIRT